MPQEPLAITLTLLQWKCRIKTVMEVDWKWNSCYESRFSTLILILFKFLIEVNNKVVIIQLKEYNSIILQRLVRQENILIKTLVARLAQRTRTASSETWNQRAHRHPVSWRFINVILDLYTYTWIYWVSKSGSIYLLSRGRKAPEGGLIYTQFPQQRGQSVYGLYTPWPNISPRFIIS